MNERMNAELLQFYLMRKLGEKMKSQLRQPVRFKSRGGNVCRKSLSPEIKEAAQEPGKKNQQKAEWGREKSTEPNLCLRNGHREQRVSLGVSLPFLSRAQSCGCSALGGQQ